jgi:hypothetical protein
MNKKHQYHLPSSYLPTSHYVPIQPHRTRPYPLLRMRSTSPGPLRSGLLSGSTTSTRFRSICLTTSSRLSSSLSLLCAWGSSGAPPVLFCAVPRSQPACSSSAAASSRRRLTAGSFSRAWNVSSSVGKNAARRAFVASSKTRTPRRMVIRQAHQVTLAPNGAEDGEAVGEGFRVCFDESGGPEVSVLCEVKGKKGDLLHL